MKTTKETQGPEINNDKPKMEEILSFFSKSLQAKNLKQDHRLIIKLQYQQHTRETKGQFPTLGPNKGDREAQGSSSNQFSNKKI